MNVARHSIKRVRPFLALASGICLMIGVVVVRHAVRTRNDLFYALTPPQRLAAAIKEGNWGEAYGLAADYDFDDEDPMWEPSASSVVEIGKMVAQVVAEFPDLPADRLAAALNRFDAVMPWNSPRAPSPAS